MSENTTALPPNVYRVAQSRFDAIPGSLFTYQLPSSVYDLFETLSGLDEVAEARQGLVTGDNFRFIRFWWELPKGRIAYDCQTRSDALLSGKKWFPVMKTGLSKRWYVSPTEVVNWLNDGLEITMLRRPDGRQASRPQNVEFYFRSGLAYSSVGSGQLSIRWMPPGFICEHATNAIYVTRAGWSSRTLTALLNAALIQSLVKISETINVNIGDLLRVPIPRLESIVALEDLSTECIRLRLAQDMREERYPGFICVWNLTNDVESSKNLNRLLTDLESQLDNEVWRAYKLDQADRASLEAKPVNHASSNSGKASGLLTEGQVLDDCELTVTVEENPVRCISFAIGVVLYRFHPGTSSEPGCATYLRSDFAVGSLPEPDEREFDELVGPADRFAYVDSEGGRHVFSAEVEQALCDLAVPDGITVLDEGHPRDLPDLVEKALILMWGEEGAQEIIVEGADGDLRKFLSRDYFTKWHLTKKWYRNRPVYWPLQSARRSYGFVIFHEKMEEDTLYVLQREYLDHKLNGLSLEVKDLQKQMDGLSGRARKQVEKDLDRTTQLLNEVTEFAATIERIAAGGYRPKPNWMDDGVILRLAPLWELIPFWRAESKRSWERLQRGDYDWSHIAMNYWPDRVKEKCQTDKSLAIAHGV